MNKLSKFFCSVGLTVTVLVGTVLSGCAESTNYTEEIKEYQAKLEALQAENEELKSQLETLVGTRDMELPATTQESSEAETAESLPAKEPEASVSENSDALALQPESRTDAAQEESGGKEQPVQTEQGSGGKEQTEQVSGNSEKKITRILVLGDSIWGNYRDDTGVAAKVEDYCRQIGHEVIVYNAAIGGTRATLDPEDNQYEFGPASESSLAKMVSILNGDTSVDLLQGKAAYEDMKLALEVRNKIDVVIVAYGMNDFLNQVPINNSDAPWTGFGTALTNGILGIRNACSQADVMIVAPTYASYFSIPVQNMGEKALYNYASVACDVAKGANTLCVDAYNNIGINAYNADEYLEDGIHLNEEGRALYARNIVSCLFYGQKGQVSGNAIEFD